MRNYVDLIENYLSQNNGLDVVEQEIKLMFLEIKNINKIEDAELIFNKLEDVQYILAKLVFKNEVEVTPFLRQFVYDFDRIDDRETKIALFNKIKKMGNIYD